ncbi:TIGR04255 family protein [Streptomyces scabiei]|uniref:TIGR04255 family protein n=1 Tax=Streptomyces scabiei TaxID=1930 RepID=UPI0029BBCACC|nr:TIGR04255 family protein [Streptomyces scabiei]MDX3114602.1 TIGR04255 family protein [Streptomyces scabiei]
MSALPDFERPPVIEVACGVQFRAVQGLRGVTLAPLYNQWIQQFPTVEEHPPLPPVVEASPVGGPAVQLFFGNATDQRLWFIDATGSSLVQLQQDRLIVNWREGEPRAEYPRFASVRDNLSARLADLSDFLERESLGKLEITHAEVSYINAIDPQGRGFGALDNIIQDWPTFPNHHLGQPTAARAAFEFPIPELGAGGALAVSVGPGGRTNGDVALFMTMTAQGRTEGTSSDAALAFVDAAHEHVVRSFAELTTDAQHAEWGRLS